MATIQVNMNQANMKTALNERQRRKKAVLVIWSWCLRYAAVWLGAVWFLFTCAINVQWRNEEDWQEVDVQSPALVSYHALYCIGWLWIHVLSSVNSFKVVWSERVSTMRFNTLLLEVDYQRWNITHFGTSKSLANKCFGALFLLNDRTRIKLHKKATFVYIK